MRPTTVRGVAVEEASISIIRMTSGQGLFIKEVTDKHDKWVDSNLYLVEVNDTGDEITFSHYSKLVHTSTLCDRQGYSEVRHLTVIIPAWLARVQNVLQVRSATEAIEEHNLKLKHLLQIQMKRGGALEWRSTAT